jgi:hypothetical protein
MNVADIISGLIPKCKKTLYQLILRKRPLMKQGMNMPTGLKRIWKEAVVMISE